MDCKTVLTLLLALAAPHFSRGEDAAARWSAKVQPILDVNCVKCHGVIEQKSGLELDTIEMVMKGGEARIERAEFRNMGKVGK